MDIQLISKTCPLITIFSQIERISPKFVLNSLLCFYENIKLNL